MSRKLIIFDVDGTLVDSQAHICEAMAQAFGALDHPVPDRADVLGIVGLSLPVAIARLAPDLPGADHDRLVEGYKAAFFTLRAETLSPLYPGAAEVLAMLSQVPDLALGIATGKSRRGMEHIIAAHDWAGRFATVQVADDHPSKPHPSMIAACLRDAGVVASDAVMIGDTTYDMEMAHAAGVQGLGVSWGYHPAERLGSRIIHQFSSLPAALSDILGVQFA